MILSCLSCKMKLIFHEKFLESYDRDPAAEEGRLDRAAKLLCSKYSLVEPVPASEDDILLVHAKVYVNQVSKFKDVYNMALLAAGGAILAARTALTGEQAFALIRPPGHHASQNFRWGFCWFNNIAIAIQKMIYEGHVQSALILDIDLHFGDGTEAIFLNRKDVTYLHMDEVENLHKGLECVNVCDLIGISAGFDRHINDWGGFMTTEEYYEVGKQVGIFSLKHCPGKVFAVLEGGYNHEVLGDNIAALLKGLEESVSD